MRRTIPLLIAVVALGAALVACDPATVATLADDIGCDPATATTQLGSQTITTDDYTLENATVTGTITIDAQRATIRNVCLHTTSTFGIKVLRPGGHLIEDVDITGELNCDMGIGYAHYTARRVDVSECEDGWKIQQGTITGSICHDLFWETPRHADCIQISNGPGPVTVSGNVLLAPFRHSNAVFQICNEQTPIASRLPIDNVLIEGNVMSGGNVMINGCPNVGVVVRNNQLEGFSTTNAKNTAWPEDPDPGLHHSFIGAAVTSHCGNVWFDNTDEFPTGNPDPFPADPVCP